MFASSTRTLRPPILVFTTIRMVWLLKLRSGAGPGFAGAAAGAPAATGVAGILLITAGSLTACAAGMGLSKRRL